MNQLCALPGLCPAAGVNRQDVFVVFAVLVVLYLRSGDYPANVSAAAVTGSRILISSIIAQFDLLSMTNLC